MRKGNRKYILYAGVLAIILVLVGTIGISGDDGNPNRIYDVNRDGSVNIGDLVWMIRFFFGGP